jgi:uncharacterized protein YrzB (UPF0473 family)
MAEEKKEAEGKEEKDEKHYIVLTDDKGKDTKVELLFSIVYPKNNTRYLYIIDPEDEDAVVIFTADEEGNIESVDDTKLEPETKNFLYDTFQAYLQGDLAPVGSEEGEEDEEEEEDSCSCGCHSHEEEGECCCGDDSCCCQDGKEEKEEGDSCCCSSHHPQVGDEK